MSYDFLEFVFHLPTYLYNLPLVLGALSPLLLWLAMNQRLLSTRRLSMKSMLGFVLACAITLYFVISCWG